MRKLILFATTTASALTLATAAIAQSPEYMIADCQLASQQFYQQFQAHTEAKYEGQRTDKSHAVNGNITLSDRSAYFSCSYDASGTKLVEFFAEKKSWPEFVNGGGSPFKSQGAELGATVKVGQTIVPKAAIDSCIADAASAMSVSKNAIRAIKAGQEGADNFYIEVASPKKHLVCSVNSKGEIFDTRYGRL
jgi:hypothetical protein